jgi:hypothetical protein
MWNISMLVFRTLLVISALAHFSCCMMTTCPPVALILRGGNEWADPTEKRHEDQSIRPPIGCHRR